MKIALASFLLGLRSVNAFVIQPCTDNSGADTGCNCAITNPGIFCPANYYCPEYTEIDVQNFQSTLAAASCTISGTRVVCPCTPGYYCPENTSQPEYCCEGYYCPADNEPVDVPDPDTGLGAWGRLIKICPEDKFCMSGQVDPFECPPLAKCEEGATKASKSASIALLIVLILLIYGLFLCRYAIQGRKRALQDKLLNEEVNKPQGKPSVGNIEAFDAIDSNSGGGAGSSISELKEAITDSRSNSTPFHIQFENLGLKLKTGTRVMQGVHGEFQPGRMCAVMGSSGAGKTTVINLITGKVAASEGRILVNGEEMPGLVKYQKLVGFVPQEDVMLRELTVRDNIQFSARYRLPASYTKYQIERKVDSCIAELGIPHVQHSIIGDEHTRGVSGGQRKRVNIGLELVTDPSIMFLDEPTSGLDSTTATSLCQTLRKITRERNMTTVAVIHQPSLTSFLEFDDLLLLGKGGRVIYHGPLNEAPDYFASIGFPLPISCNPSDFYLDVACGVIPCKNDPHFEWPKLFDLWESTRLLAANQAKADSQRMTVATKEEQDTANVQLHELDSMSLPDLWKTVKSLALQLYFEAEDYVVKVYKDTVDGFRNIGKPDPVRETPGALKHFTLVVQRGLKQVFRRFSVFMLEMGLHLGAGFVISVAAERLEYIGPYPNVICDVAVLGFQDDCRLPQKDQFTQAANFMCFGVLFSAVASAAGTFGNEQVNYFREAASGLLSVPYFFGKWLTDFPRVFGATVFFYLAFSIRFQNTSTDSTELFSLILAFYWYGFSMGYLVSQIVSMKQAALTGVLVALIFAVALSGINPTMSEVQDKPRSQQILWAISGPRWAVEGFYISQIKYYETVPNGDYEGASYIDIQPGLDNTGYEVDNFKTCIRAMFLNGIGWGLLALLVMVVSNRDKKR